MRLIIKRIADDRLDCFGDFATHFFDRLCNFADIYVYLQIANELILDRVKVFDLLQV